MTNQALITASSQPTSLTLTANVPSIIEAAGSKAKRRFVEFFLATIENDNTRAAYMEACARFLHWCELGGFRLETIEPVVVSTYFKQGCPETRPDRRSKPKITSKASKKQHLAGVRRMFDELTHTGVIEFNPAASVRGPKLKVTKGLTPVMDEDQARHLLESIPLTRKDGSQLISGLRDRAMIGTMIYAFARVNAVTGLDMGHLDNDGRNLMLRLHEKNGKILDIPAHHKLARYIDEYIEAADLGNEAKDAPLFRTLDRRRNLTETRMQRQEVGAVWKRRCKAAGLSSKYSNHTGRGTGLTNYMLNDGDLEDARAMAGHETTRTTKMYVRVEKKVLQPEVEKIKI